MSRVFREEKTPYKGVTFIMGTGADGKPEKIFYASYRRNGKRYHERIGRARRDGMTPGRANIIRAELIDGKRLPRKEQRRQDEETKRAEEGRYTLNKLWNLYQETHPTKRESSDKSYYKYLEEPFGRKEPQEIDPVSVSRVMKQMRDSKKAEGTVWNMLELLKRLINFGVNKNLCSPLPFKIGKNQAIEMPKLKNKKTERLTAEQWKRLRKALHTGIGEIDGKEVYLDEAARDCMMLEILTGMRRSEVFNLKHSDIRGDGKFVYISDPKGGNPGEHRISKEALEILLRQPKTDSPYIFPGRKGKKRKTNSVAVNKIKKAAGLPADFRPNHGLRHAIASYMVSELKYPLYTMKEFLRHSSIKTTERYAHLSDEIMEKASADAASIITGKG